MRLYLTTALAAKYIGTSADELKRLVAAGEIVPADSAPLGGSLFARSELDRWLAARNTVNSLVSLN